jgi:Uncharacterized protein involved in formation of curli polymers
MKKILLTCVLFVFTMSTFAQREVVEIESPATEIGETSKTLKRKVAIGRFSNETQYAKGLFYDKENDPMGKQALDILSARLASSEKFILLERSDMDKLAEEAQISGSGTAKIGADFLIIGSITQYGRKNVGDVKMFSTSKTQIVEAAVSIRLIDVSTGLIIYSDEAKGEAELKTKTTMGVGGRADFDATLSDKAISAAISQLVENIINKCTDKPWKSYFLAYDDDVIIVSGGMSQGIEVGDMFTVMKKGKTVKNPQTGINIELPGKAVGQIKIEMVGGDMPESEYSIVSFTSGDIDKDNIQDYYIEEEKK